MSGAAISPASAAAAAAAAADAQQPATCSKGSGGGLRNPLEDADIFDTLFHKWGGDDAAEAAAVGALGDFLFEADGGMAAAAATCSRRAAVPAATQQQQQEQSQQPPQQHSQQLEPGSMQALKQATLDKQQAACEQQQAGDCSGAAATGGDGAAAGAAAAAAEAGGMQGMRANDLMVSQHSMQAMQAALQAQQQFFAQGAPFGQQPQQQAGAGGFQLPGGFNSSMQMQLGPFGMPEPPPPASGLPFGSGFGPFGPWPMPGALGPPAGGMFASMATGLPPTLAGLPGFPGMGSVGALPWQQQQQQQQQQQFAQLMAAAAAGMAPPAMAGPSAAPGDGAAGAPTAEAPVPAAPSSSNAWAAPAARQEPLPAAHSESAGAANLAAAAATGGTLPLLQLPLAPQLLTAMSSMAAAPGQGAQPAGIDAAGLLPGGWPLHLMGLLHPPPPPPLAAPNVMQLALMMQAAQAAGVPGGGDLQQAALLVAAVQSMACSHMMGPWGPAPLLPPPWQQQHAAAAAAAAQPNHLTASCLGQYGHIMSSTQGFAGHAGGGGAATMLRDSHQQIGSHPGGGMGSHIQTSTTGDYSGGHQQRPSASYVAFTGSSGHPWQQCGPGMAAAAAAGAGDCSQQWHLQAPVAATAAPAAEPATTAAAAHEPAGTPRHRNPSHRPAGGRRSRAAGRSRANNRPRVNGRFVKKGMPGGAPMEHEQQQHTTSEHDASEADTLDDDEQQHGEAAAAAGWRTSCMSLPQSSSPVLGGSADPPRQQQLEAGGVMRHSSTSLDKHGRVEALYSLKRSWVQQQQQLDSASADADAAAAAADGHALRMMRAASMQQQQQSPPFVLKRPRYSQSLPGAGGAPSATSDGGGEGSAGIFDAPADYGGSASLLRAVSGTRDTTHTQCLHLCDSNRLVASKGTAGRPPEPAKQQQQQQPRLAATAAGSKRKSCDSGGGRPAAAAAAAAAGAAVGGSPITSGGALAKQLSQPPAAAAAGAAVGGSPTTSGGALARQLSQPPSRIAPAAPDVCAGGGPGGTASMPASFVQLTGMLANEQPGGSVAAAQHAQALASSHQQGGVAASVHAGEDGSSKRMRADDHAAPVAAAVARLPVAILAPAPVDEAAAAAQMPPPAPQAPHRQQQHHHHPDGPLPAEDPAATTGMGMMLGPGGVGLPTGFWMQQQQQQLWGLAPGQQHQLLQHTLGLSAPAFPPATTAAAVGGGTGMLQLSQAMPLSPVGLWPGALLASAAWRPWATSALATVPASVAAGALQPPALLGAPFGSVGFHPAAAHTTALMAAALNGAAGGPLFGGPILQQAAAAGTAGPPAATHRRHGGGSEQTDSCRA